MKILNSILILATILLMVGCQQAVETAEDKTPMFAEVTSDEVGLSTDSLKSLDALIQEFMDRDLIPGATAMIIKDGKIPLYKAWGHQDIDDNDAMEKDNIFRIASMTKAITSTAILMLHEEGKLNIEDPLSKFISAFKDATIITGFEEKDSSWTSVPSDTAITLRHLLTHTSGISYGFLSPNIGAIYTKIDVPDGPNISDETIQENMTDLAKAPLFHRPGAKWTYGLSTDVLGAVVEIVSGQTLAEFLNARIFEPLNMKDTDFYFPDSKASRLVRMYSEIKDTMVEFQDPPNSMFSADFPVKGHKTYYSGGGGLNSTVWDYNIFLQMILNGGSLGDIQFLKKETVDLMITNQIGALEIWGGQKFGLAFSVTSKPIEGKRPLNAFGWGGAFQTTYWADPANNMSVVLHTNVYPHTKNEELYDRFERIVYSSLSSK